MWVRAFSGLAVLLLDSGDALARNKGGEIGKAAVKAICQVVLCVHRRPVPWL